MSDYHLLLAVLAQSAGDDGVTFHDILSNVPTDGATIFTLLLLIGSIGLAAWFGVPRGGGRGKGA